MRDSVGSIREAGSHVGRDLAAAPAPTGIAITIGHLSVGLERLRDDVLGKSQRSSKLQAVTAARLWTVHDVSAFLGVPVGTLYQWWYMRVGPPAYRVGRHIRYDPAAGRTWLDTQDAYGR